MGKLNIKKNFKANMKGNRIKGYIVDNEIKLEELLKKQLKEEEEWINKLKQAKEQQEAEQDEDSE